MRLRRRLAELIAPPDDWSSLPPLPGPTPLDAPPARGDVGYGLLFRLMAEARGDGRGATSAVLRRWFDGNPDATIDAYLPAGGRVAVVSSSPCTGRLLAARTPGRRVVELGVNELLSTPGTPTAAPGGNGVGAAPARTAAGDLDAVALVDVVGSLPTTLAARLLRRAAELVKPGATVVLVDRTNRPRWKAAVAALGRTGRLAAGHGLTPTPKPAAAWLRLVEETGLVPQAVPWRSPSVTPWCLVVGYRPAEPQPAR